MKRPEGFDPPGNSAPEPKKPPRKAAPARQPAATPTRPHGAPPVRERTIAAQERAQVAPKATRPASGASSRQARPDPSAKKELRRASRARRRFERSEVRRFTRRARTRRLTAVTLAGLVVTLIGLVLLAVYSPLLALRHVTIDGTDRVDAAALTDAVEEQLGTPLALIDYDAITRQLGAFALIRSYVTEIVPPDTLFIHVTEREPVGSIKVGAIFQLVDPAGIALQDSAERLDGIPLIDLPGGDTSSPAFASMVEVLLALPSDLLDQVDTISASTQDDVTLTLSGVNQSVRWGSASESDRKAILLAALIDVTKEGKAGVFDVSAPGNGVFRPR